jgi:hypothetical protein
MRELFSAARSLLRTSRISFSKRIAQTNTRSSPLALASLPQHRYSFNSSERFSENIDLDNPAQLPKIQEDVSHFLKKYNEIFSEEDILSLTLEKLFSQDKEDLSYKKLHFLISHASGIHHYDNLTQGKIDIHTETEAKSPFYSLLNTFSERRVDVDGVEEDSKKGTTLQAKEDDLHKERECYEEQKSLDKHKGLKPLLHEIWLNAINKQRRNKRVFISYAWPVGDEHHEAWVKPFVETLAKHLTYTGLQIYLDEYQSGAGYDLAKHMKEIRKADHVLLISTRTMQMKLLKPESGVSFEHSEMIKRQKEMDILLKDRFVIPVLLNFVNYCHPEFKNLAEINICSDGYLNALRMIASYIYGFGQLDFRLWWKEQLKLHRLGESEREHKQEVWGKNIFPNPFYVQRAFIRNRISSSLRLAREKLQPQHSISLYGMQGAGKFEIARYIFLHPPVFYNLRLIFNAESSEKLEFEYFEFGSKFCNLGTSASPNKETAKKIKSWLEENPGWLIIYSNIEHFSKIKELIPITGGQIIFTSPQPLPATDVESYEVSYITQKESIALIEKTIGKKVADAEKLHDEFKGLAELIKIAALDIKLTPSITSVDEYLLQYRNTAIQYFSNPELVFGQHNHLLFASLSLSLAKLEIHDSRVKFLLAICAYLDADRISFDLLAEIFLKIGFIAQGGTRDKDSNWRPFGEDVFSHITKVEEGYSLDKALRALEFKFITINKTDRYITIPKSYQTFIRILLGNPIKYFILKNIVNSFSPGKFLNVVHHDSFSTLSIELPKHINTVISHFRELSIDRPDQIYWVKLLEYGAFVNQIIDPEKSIIFAEMAISLYDVHFKNDPDSASVLVLYCITTGAILDRESNVDKKKILAEKYYKYVDQAKALFTSSQNKIDEHDKINILHQFGNAQGRRGKVNDCIAHLNLAVKRIKNSGKDSELQKLSILKDLTVAYVEAGEFQNAIQVGEETLQLMLRHTPHAYTNILEQYSNLAIAYYNYALKHMNYHYLEKSVDYEKKGLEFFNKIPLKNMRDRYLFINESLKKRVKEIEVVMGAYNQAQELSKFIIENKRYIQEIYKMCLNFSPEEKVGFLNEILKAALAKRNEDFSKPVGMVNIASVYLMLGNPGQALIVLNHALSFQTSKHLYSLETVRLYLTFSEAYHKTKDPKNALKYLELANQILSENIFFANTVLVKIDFKELVEKYKTAAQEDINEIYLHLHALLERFQNHGKIYSLEQTQEEFLKQLNKKIDPKYIEKIHSLLNHNAPAIHLAIALMKSIHLSPEKFIEQYMTLNCQLDNNWLTQQPIYCPIEILICIVIAIQYLEKNCPKAIDIVNICAHFNSGAIPLFFLQEFLTSHEILTTFSILNDLGFIKVDPQSESCIQIHMHIQSALKLLLRSNDKENNSHQIKLIREVFKKFEVLLNFLGQKRDKSMIVKMTLLMPHIDKFLQHAFDLKLKEYLFSFLPLLANYAHFILGNSLYAINCLERFFHYYPSPDKMDEVPEKLCLFYAESYRIYACAKTYLGEGKSAEEYFAKTLMIFEKYLKPTDIKIARTLNDYSIILEPEQKINFLLRAKEILSGDSTQNELLARVLTNLAITYCSMSNKIDEAKNLIQEALRITMDKSKALNIKATILIAAGEGHALIEEVLRESLALQDEQLTEDHPERARTLTLLGDVLKKSKPQEAIVVLNKALEIDSQVYGSESYFVGLIKSSLSLASFYLNNIEAAKKSYNDALQIYKALQLESQKSKLHEALMRTASTVNATQYIHFTYPTNDSSNIKSNYTSGLFHQKSEAKVEHSAVDLSEDCSPQAKK